MADARHNFAALKEGDFVADRGLFSGNDASEKRVVVKRSPKYLTLDNGVKLHVESCTNSYEVWSDEREAERAKNWEREAMKRRVARLPLGCHVSVDDALRNPDVLERLERLCRDFETEKNELCTEIKR